MLGSVAIVFNLCLLLECLEAQQPEKNDVTLGTAHFYADVGSNVSLPCSNISTVGLGNKYPVMWVREGKTFQHSHVEQNGVLNLYLVTSRDAGIYQCRVDSDVAGLESFGYQVELHVKTPPHAPANVTVYPSTVLALVTWKLAEDGGYPVKHVTVIYQNVTDDYENPSWHRTYPERVGPGMTQLEVYRLIPNTTYRFRVWATNRLGPGDYTEAIVVTKPTTDHNGVGNPLIRSSKDFDTRIWVAAVSVVFGTLMALIIVLLGFSVVDRKFRRRRRRPRFEVSEGVELMTNIITNPTYGDAPAAAELITVTDDETSDRQSLIKLNSNPVVRPARL